MKNFQEQLFSNDLMIRAIQMTTNEIQLLQMPYFCISTEKKNSTKVEYNDKIKANGKNVNRQWIVRSHQDFGWPRELEASVWRAIEHIMHNQRQVGMLKNPVVTTLSEIRQYMPSKCKGGRNLKTIVKAIKCLAHTKVESNFWYRADARLSASASFSLINNYFFKTRIQKNGIEVISQTDLEIHNLVFANIISGYVRPLDHGYRIRLKKWLSRRLYEILGIKFFGLRKTKYTYNIKYSQLCLLLGSQRQLKFSYAKRILSRAHSELLKSGFLLKVEWCQCKFEKKNWVLRYWPGPRARSEWNKDYFKYVEDVNPVRTTEYPEVIEEPVWTEVLVESTPEIIIEAEPSQPKVSVAELQGDISKKLTEENNEHIIKNKVLLTEDVVVKIYEKVVGRRKMPTLSENEQALVDKWNKAGVTPVDVEKGLNGVIHQESVKAKHTGRTPCPIWSLSYCEWGVWAAFDSRQKAEERQKNLEKEQAEIEENKRKRLEKEAALEEKRKSYTHIPQWAEIQEKYQKSINAENYEKIIRIILSSRWNNETLHLLMSDSFASLWFEDNYLDKLIELSGAKKVELEIEEPI